MVAKRDIKTSLRVIEDSLKQFVGGNGSPRVRVLETQWGHIHALVGSDKFKDVGLGQRQEMIWEYLRKNVTSEYLALLYGVTTMDEASYDEVMRDIERRALEDLGLG